MKKVFRVVIAAQNPGGFNAILPVIKGLSRRKDFSIKSILANQAKDTAKKNRIPCVDGSIIKGAKLLKIIKKEHPDLIFTATSLGNSLEKKVLNTAKKLGIKTASFIDFWSNYKVRFSAVPDHILVIDETMKKEMVSKGFPARKIVITGSPAFDGIRPAFVPPAGGTTAGREGKFISFFSQPLVKTHILEDLLQAIEKLNIKLPVRVKLHPREENPKKFNDIIKNKKSLDIKLEKRLSSEDLMNQSKLVMGQSTMALFLAALMGKKVLSYQPGLKWHDALVSNRLGLSTAVYKKDDLAGELKKLLFSKAAKDNSRIIAKYTKNNSTEKIINFIYKALLQ